MKPLLSVCLITYNQQNYIEQAIESVLMQQVNFSWQLIIADDCSTDETGEIIKAYQNKFPDFIKLILQEKNVGPAQNFMELITYPSSKYIAYLEGDDYWTDPDKLQKQVDFLEANDDYSLCFTCLKTKNYTTGIFEDDNNEQYFKNNDSNIEFDFDKFLSGWHIGSQTTLFKRECVEKFQFSKYKYFKDVTLYSILLSKGKGVCLNFFGAVYRKHDTGVYSGASELKNASSGYLTYKEIYLKNSTNPYLKAKFIKFTKGYIEALLQAREFKKAGLLSFELFYYDFNLNYLLVTLKFILRHKSLPVKNFEI